jgi:hypothetical protein
MPAVTRGSGTEFVDDFDITRLPVEQHGNSNQQVQRFKRC